MDTMSNLCSALRHTLKLDLENNRTVQVAQATVEYLCGVIDAYAYQRYLKENVRFRDLDISAKDFRLMLIEKSYFTLNIKFFCLNLCKVTVNLPNINQYAVAFELVRNDVVLLRRAFEVKKFRTDMRRSERVQSVELVQIQEGAVEEARKSFNGLYGELVKHIRQKSFKKLRFLVKAENTEHHDYNSEVLCKVIKAYYMLVPTTMSRAHVLNYLRSTCTNHILNIISSRTSDKRRRLTNVGSDGFGGNTYSQLCVSENQLTAIEGEDVMLYDSTLNAVNQHDNNRMISDLNFDRLVQNYGKSSTRRRAILITSGQEDSRFTRHLRLREIIKPDEDCTDFVARNKHDTVVTHMAAHFNVCPERLDKFLKKVAKELVKHRSVA